MKNFNMITSKHEAIQNIKKYNNILNNIDAHSAEVRNDIIRTLSMARSWYGYEEDGKWYVSNAKFIGFRGINADFYAKNRIEMSATQAENILQKFCSTPVNSDHPAVKALEDLTSRFDRRPSALARVSIIAIDDTIEGGENFPKIPLKAAVSAVIALAAQLPEEEIKMLKEGINNL